MNKTITIKKTDDIMEMIEAVDKARRELGNTAVQLVFSEPVELRHGKRMSATSTKTNHDITRLFIHGTTLCQVPTRNKVSGYPIDNQTIEKLLRVEVKQISADYSREWRRIAKSMRKYNINLGVARDIEAHLRGDEPHIKGFQNYWTKNDKPRTTSFRDVLIYNGIARYEMETGVTYQSRELEKLRTIKLNNEAIPTMIARARESAGKYYRASKSGHRRDRSVALSVNSDGDVGYHSASEYAGCLNGDYYVMYSPTMAFYAETD